MSRIQVPIGPQHPALKEPENFTLTLEGEVVVDALARIGYNHRGIEKACEQRTYSRCVYLLERICGICSHSHTTCFVQAVEEIMGLEVPPRALYIRTIVAELERIHSHLLWLGVAGHEVGFDTFFMYTWRDRELVMDLLELISGNRVNYAINNIGGVRRDLGPEAAEGILRALPVLEERTRYYQHVATNDSTFLARLQGVGVIPYQQAVDLCAVGPLARASGVDADVRRDEPYAAYGEIPFNVITHTGGDNLARAVVRVGELYESIGMLRYCVEHLPDGPIAVRPRRRVGPGEAISRYEAPRGEDIHYVRANGSDRPDRVKVRAPTLANLPTIMQALRGVHLADVPITLASIDPCFSCTDRLVRLAPAGGGDGKVWTWAQLRDYGIRWYGGKPDGWR